MKYSLYSIKIEFFYLIYSEFLTTPPHWQARNQAWNNLIVTISLILLILFIVLILLGVLFVYLLQHRRRLAKAQEFSLAQQQFSNLQSPGTGGRYPLSGRMIPKIPPDELDDVANNEYEAPRYEMNFLPTTRHQASNQDDKEMIYETILEEDDEERLLRQHNRKAHNALPAGPLTGRLDVPEYLEIRPATPERKYINFYANN